MADYLVTGKKGNGKSLVCVGRIQDALRAGKKVATNLDITLEKLLPASSRATLVRVPDRLRRVDLELIGRGQPGIEEEKNGLLVLDECASWLNAREYRDSDRAGFLDWLVHSRKLGWDVYFIAQDQSMVDKQLRTGLVEFLVGCKRLDRLRVPFLTGFVSMITGGVVKIRPPKVHVALVKYGLGFNDPVSDRWWYRGRDLYDAYNTEQVFCEDYPHGVHSLLSPWHLVGRYHRRFSLRAWLRDLWECPPRPRVGKPAARLSPLLRLPSDLRWRAARRLVMKTAP